MDERIDDKIKEIETYLSQLSERVPANLEEYKSDFFSKAAFERYAEKIPEALVDLAFLVVKDKNLDAPKDDNGAFVILAKNNIISVELSEKLQDAKGMRNIIAHEYGKINDAIVFHAVSEELVKDSREFINSISKTFEERKVDKAGDEED